MSSTSLGAEPPAAPAPGADPGRRLVDETAFVTGAGSGIGRATVELFAQHGAAVCVTDLNADAAQSVAEGIVAAGGRAVAYTLDVSDSAMAASVVASALDEFGGIDILVNCAGGSRKVIGPYRSFLDSDEEGWDTIIGVNLKGPLICTKAVLGQMVDRRHGRILNLGSVAGVCGLEKMVDYSAAKAGVSGMTRALAMEVAPYGITVNCVAPGMIGTEAGSTTGTYLGRNGQPWEVAALLLHLASPEGGFITGETIVIDGGRVLGPKRGMA